LQLGFVIDHSRCIGCHACSVACKAENDVPLGRFRTWVKYTEQGTYPEVRRSFAVLRCNQCSDAPCVAICPVAALKKRPDGIVDVDPARCIGCKGCMQGCPYEALYINDSTGTAEKCHFCAHRVELGLAPACAVVCPTEAIVPGDFDDPQSRVATLKAGGDLKARKTEAGTGPNVLYKEVADAGIDPQATQAGAGYLWSDRPGGIQQAAELFDALERRASATTVYDVHHPPLWGAKVSAYLFTKSLASGAFLGGVLLWPPLSFDMAPRGPSTAAIAGVALLFLAVTTLFLVGDLKRPERFWFILRFANWRSWLARGTLVLSAYGGLATLWLVLGAIGYELPPNAMTGLVVVTDVAAVLTAIYTAWLFRQAKGRVLWLRRTLELELLVHALVAGSALWLLLGPLWGLESGAVDPLRRTLLVSLAGHAVLLLLESRFAPARREREYSRTVRLISHGPFARRRWLVGVTLGIVVPGLLLLVSSSPVVWAGAGGLALIGLFVEQDTLVRAGQSLAIS
jgi:Fe-S-cluster-containing dehydrogenase component/formate-dependent nitrite reductase membrane component NrfD